MFFVFGWRTGKPEDYGACMPAQCNRYGNESLWHLLHTQSWFTLFFIPLIPYNSRHYLACPICMNAEEIHGSQVEEMKALCESAKKLQDKLISTDEFLEKVNACSLVQTADKLPASQAALPQCPECGIVYNLATYREDAEHIYCSACQAELPRKTQVSAPELPSATGSS